MHETAKGSKQEVGVQLIGNDDVLTDPWKHFKTFAGGVGVVLFAKVPAPNETLVQNEGGVGVVIAILAGVAGEFKTTSA
jgi:hypothetical protein